MLLFLDVVRDATVAGALVAGPAHRPALAPRLEAQLRSLTKEFAAEVSEERVSLLLYGFSQLLGMISLELYGHFVGSIDPTEPFFDYSMATTADLIGLPPAE